jgi:hypothetical protein
MSYSFYTAFPGQNEVIHLKFGPITKVSTVFL